jgi:hypothetical protein
MIHFLRKFLVTGNHTILRHLIAEIMWATWLSLYAASVYARFYDFAIYKNLFTAVGFMRNFATLYSVIDAASILMQATFQPLERKVLGYTVILMIHFSLVTQRSHLIKRLEPNTLTT